MKWAWRMGEIAGIGIYVHATFLLLLGWVGLAHWSQGQSLVAVIDGVAFILALFGCVVLHELGHALMARRYGIKTRDITLLPIGGVARLERMPEDPRQELLVALAGPAVNVVIAVTLFLWLWVTASWQPVADLTLTAGSFLERLMVVNVGLVVFNLLPAFPMDGGRVLRALLATRLEYSRATQIAAGIGQAMALLFGFLGFFLNPFLFFVALFVWIGASQEAGLAQMKAALGGIPVSRAMVTDFRGVSPQDSLRDVVKLILTGSQQDFPVLEDGALVGVLTSQSVLTALAREGEAALVGAVMQREFQVAEASEMLEGAFLRLQSCGCRTMPVVRRGALIGLLTMENLGEFLMIQSALGSARKQKPVGSR